MAGHRKENKETMHYLQEVSDNLYDCFSAKWIHGVFATNKTFNSEKFICFLKPIHNYADKEYVVIWDNSKVLVAKPVHEYLNKLKVWDISILPTDHLSIPDKNFY